MKISSRKIWAVDARDRNGSALPEGDLLVIAPTPLKASQKATKYLQKNYPTHKVQHVYFEGEIDIL